MKALLVEDNPADARLIRELLKDEPGENFQLQHERRLDRALQRMEQDAFDVALLDLGLPDSQGIETLARAQDADPGLPVVVLTGLDDQGFALSAVRMGAQDYLVKGRLDRELLVRTIRYAVERKRTQQEIRRLNAELEQRVAERTAELQASNDAVLREMLERRIAEEARHASDERFRVMFQHAPVGIALGDLQGRLVETNPAFEDLIGYTKTELAGMSLADLTHPDDLPAEQTFIKELLAGSRQCYDIEKRYLRKDGTSIWVRLTGSVLRNYRGELEYGLAVVQDITRRKRSEEALRESEERLRSLAENVPCVLMRFDRQLRIVYLSKQSGRYNPNPVERMTGRTNREMGMPEHLCELWDAAIARVFRTGNQEELEFDMAGPSGMRTFALKLAPEFGPDHEVQYVLGVSCDITERKQAEEALRMSEAKYRSLFESLDEGFCIIEVIFDEQGRSVDYRFLEINPAFEQRTGLINARGQSMRELAPAHEEHWFETYGRIALTGQPERFENRAEQLHRWYDVYAWRHGRPEDRQVAILFNDVSERKRAERELAELLKEREQLLASERFARGEAEHASRMKDEFIATLSHELRNPLNAILGWAQLLRRPHRSPEDIAQGVQVIENSGRMLADMVTDLLDVSRIVGGKLRLDIQTLELQPIIAAAVETVRSAADAKRIAVVTMCDKQVGCVRGDPSRLQQIFWNLLSNAVKFTEPGGNVCVTARRTAAQVEIRVCDTGQGIAPEFLSHLFERFRQEDGSMSRKYGGLGLGLSIVRSLVELHGGTVHADSEGKGKGASFTVILPVPAVPDEGEQAGDRRIGPSEPLTVDWTNTTLDGIKIVLVDDEPEALEMVKRVLAERFAQVFTATCAQQGMELLQHIRPHVLISDIGMPEEDGLQFMRRVRALDPDCGGATPAVALTAYAGLDDRARAMVCGYQAHLPKPVAVNRLVATVASLAGRVAFAPDGSAAQREVTPAE